MNAQEIVPFSVYDNIKEGRNIEQRVLQPRDYLLARPSIIHNHDPIEARVENGKVVGYRFHLGNPRIVQNEDGTVSRKLYPSHVEFLAEPLDNGEYKTLKNHKRWCESRANTRKARVPSLPEFLEAAYQAHAMQDVHPAARAFLQNIQRLMPDNWYCFDSTAKYNGERATITHTDANGAHIVEETIPTFTNNQILLAREKQPGLIGTNEENLDEVIHKALQTLGGQYCTPTNLQQLALIQRNVTRDEACYQDKPSEYNKWVRKNKFRPTSETINLAREVRLQTPNSQLHARHPERILCIGGYDIVRLCIDINYILVRRAFGVVDLE